MSPLAVERPVEGLRRPAGAAGRRPRGPGRIADGRAGPLGLRQDDAAARDRGLRARRTRGRSRSAGATLDDGRTYVAPGAARHRLRAAGGRAVPAPDRRGQRRLRALARRAPRQRRSASCSRWSASRRSRERLPHAALRRRAAARGARPRARPPARRRCCSTSRSPRSTRRCARSVREEVHALLRAQGVTTVLVTHDQEEALSLADTRRGAARGHDRPAGQPRPSCTSGRPTQPLARLPRRGQRDRRASSATGPRDDALGAARAARRRRAAGAAGAARDGAPRAARGAPRAKTREAECAGVGGPRRAVPLLRPRRAAADPPRGRGRSAELLLARVHGEQALPVGTPVRSPRAAP